MSHRLRTALRSPRGIFWLAQAGGWTAYGLSTFLTLLASLPPEAHASYLTAKLLRAGMGLAASLVLFHLYRAMFVRRVRPAAILGAGLAACGGLGALWLLAYRLIVAPTLLTAPPPFGWDVFPRAALDLSFVLLAWSGIYLGARYWRIVQDRERELLRAERLAEEARFLTLSYQLNPHFLFNSLNSIRALIGEDSGRAREVVTAFAELLRYTLSRDPASRVTLGEEMEIVSRYLSLEAIRFEERLDAAVALEAGAEECLVPAFLVHPLVENAVKHGSSPAGGPLRVRLHAAVHGDRLRIEVANSGSLTRDGTGRAAVDVRDRPVPSTRIGWSNIRSRLHHLYPSDHRFEVEESDGWVRIGIEVPAVRSRQEALSVA